MPVKSVPLLDAGAENKPAAETACPYCGCRYDSAEDTARSPVQIMAALSSLMWCGDRFDPWLLPVLLMRITSRMTYAQIASVLTGAGHRVTRMAVYERCVALSKSYPTLEDVLLCTSSHKVGRNVVATPRSARMAAAMTKMIGRLGKKEIGNAKDDEG